MGLVVSLTPPAYHAWLSRAWEYIIVTSSKSRWLGMGKEGGPMVVVSLCGLMMSLDHSAKMRSGVGCGDHPGAGEGVGVEHRHSGFFSSRLSLRLWPAGNRPKGAISF